MCITVVLIKHVYKTTYKYVITLTWILNLLTREKQYVYEELNTTTMYVIWVYLTFSVFSLNVNYMTVWVVFQFVNVQLYSSQV